MKGQRSKRQLSKSFTVVIQPLSTRFIKPSLCGGKLPSNLHCCLWLREMLVIPNIPQELKTSIPLDIWTIYKFEILDIMELQMQIA